MTHQHEQQLNRYKNNQCDGIQGDIEKLEGVIKTLGELKFDYFADVEVICDSIRDELGCLENEISRASECDGSE